MDKKLNLIPGFPIAVLHNAHKQMPEELTKAQADVLVEVARCIRAYCTPRKCEDCVFYDAYYTDCRFVSDAGNGEPYSWDDMEDMDD